MYDNQPKPLNMEENTGRFKPGDKRAAELGSRGGKLGGSKSPTNFKNNRKLASRAGKIGKPYTRKERQKAKEFEDTEKILGVRPFGKEDEEMLGGDAFRGIDD